MRHIQPPRDDDDEDEYVVSGNTTDEWVKSDTTIPIER